MIELAQSPVEFQSEPHGYKLGTMWMSGVTSLIKSVLGLGNYPEASDFVRNVAIPRAGEYGTSVHRAIETYDKLGIKVTSYPKSFRFRKTIDDDAWEVAEELETYIRNREGFEPIANEYTVSDEERYASNIDNVWMRLETGGIWLVDTKTNNLDFYPGGVPGLKEYLSWQLSIYAMMFERQNPSLKVEGLACNWLRHDDGEFWNIPRKPEWQVKLLLSVPWVRTPGGIVYQGEQVADILGAGTGIAPAQTKQVMAAEEVSSVFRALKAAEETKRIVSELKDRLCEAMEDAGVKAWDAGLFRATVANDSEVETFDTARFKRDHPDLYGRYLKTTVRKGGIRIKLRDDE